MAKAKLPKNYNRKKVALKLLEKGLDVKEVVAKLRAMGDVDEIQQPGATVRLIAKTINGGTSKPKKKVVKKEEKKKVKKAVKKTVKKVVKKKLKKTLKKANKKITKSKKPAIAKKTVKGKNPAKAKKTSSKKSYDTDLDDF